MFQAKFRLEESYKHHTISTPEQFNPVARGAKGAPVAEITSRQQKKRFGAKIRSLLSGGNFRFWTTIVIAVMVLTLRGSSGEGQSGVLGFLLRSYIEETSVSLANVVKSQNQLAEINSVYATGSQNIGQGGPGNNIPLATIQENSVIAQGPASNDYIDEGGFQRTGVIEYTVQPGDLISFIASDYGVSARSILWANNLRDADALSIGQKLRIPPVSGVIHKVKKGDTALSIAKKYGVEEQKIIEFNDLPQGGQLAIDDEIMVPDGVLKGTVAVATGTTSTARVGKYTIAGSIRTFKQFAHLPDLVDYFMPPTSGYNWGILHGRNGVDVANSCGTNIYAAAGGVVTISDEVGYNGGFGKYVKLTHSNGTETVYGHGKKLLVAIGQTVSKGQLIALMGTTGRSTGCHLHFEVHGARNPMLKYK